jgi:DNA-directed RNA polymerase specialized sigma24 family protein
MDLNSPAESRPVQPQTRWSLIARVQAEDPRVRENAMNELLAIYYPVLRKYLVAGMGLSPDAAVDLLQGFVADKILGQDALAGVRAQKGRFRNFLLTACRHYVIGEMRKQQARKRAPADAALASVEELHSLPSADPSHEHHYNLEWARHTLAEALARMRRECAQKGRPELWDIFDGRILQPLLGGGTALPYEALVARYGFQSPTQATNALITAKRMFKRLLEEVVRDTVETDAQVEEEIRELKRVLSK